MAKRKNDGVRRVMLQVYVAQSIPLSAERSKMTNAEFIEAMFNKFKEGSIPDEMPLAEKESKYVDLDRQLRALGAVISQEKEEATKSTLVAQEKEAEEALKVLAAQKTALDEGEWIRAQEWFNTLPKIEKDRIGWFRKAIIPAWKEHAKPVIQDA
jgi:hypothetical protein